MRKTFWDKRIPSLLGLLFLVISIGISTWFGQYYVTYLGKASGGDTPSNVQISNITDTSFTVTFTTDDATTGSINYGKSSQLGLVMLDNRDQQLNKSGGTHKVHYITISQLNPSTKYYFSIQSGATAFLLNGEPYTATTAPSIPNKLQDNKPVIGSVNSSDGTIPEEGIVYIYTDYSGLLSTLLKPDGSYTFPIASMRNKSLTEYLPITNDTIFQMKVTSGQETSEVTVLATHTSPVPLITLSKSYDFSAQTTFSGIKHSSESATASSSGTASSSATTSPAPQLSFPSFDSTVASGPAILVPRDNDARFTDQQPLFQGTAVPKENVQITIQSAQELKTSLTADEYGNWQFRPSTPLDPGEHTITIVTKDANGIMQTLTRSFTVYASGSQFIEPSISPSVSPTTDISPTSSASSTPTTAAPTPTLTPTVITPTSAPTQAISSPTLNPAELTATQAAADLTGQESSRRVTQAAPGGGTSILVAGAVITLLSIATGFMLFFI